MDDLQEENACLIDFLVMKYIDSICMKDSFELFLFQSIEHPMNKYLELTNVSESLNSLKVIENSTYVPRFEILMELDEDEQ